LRPGEVSPVPQKTRLDVLWAQRCLEENILLDVDLTDRQKIRGLPIAVYPLEKSRGE
jgi:hypothetical protein